MALAACSFVKKGANFLKSYNKIATKDTNALKIVEHSLGRAQPLL